MIAFGMSTASLTEPRRRCSRALPLEESHRVRLRSPLGTRRLRDRLDELALGHVRASLDADAGRELDQLRLVVDSRPPFAVSRSSLRAVSFAVAFGRSRSCSAAETCPRRRSSAALLRRRAASPGGAPPRRRRARLRRPPPLAAWPPPACAVASSTSSSARSLGLLSLTLSLLDLLRRLRRRPPAAPPEPPSRRLAFALHHFVGGLLGLGDPLLDPPTRLLLHVRQAGTARSLTCRA